MRSILVVALAACGGTNVAIDAPSNGDAAPMGRLFAYATGKNSITRFSVDRTTGALRDPLGTSTDQGTTFLAFGPNALYAVSEAMDRVSSFRLAADGKPTFVDVASSGGSGPAHVAVDAQGTHVLVSNYDSGDVIVYPIGNDGTFGTSTAMLHAGANAHQMVVDPSNRYAFVPCLGDDLVAQYTYDHGALVANGSLAAANGAGPRHLAFTPDGRDVYVIAEKASTLTAAHMNGGNGRLTAGATVTTRAAGATGNNTTAEVVVHPSGKFVYGSNRGDDNIAIFDAALAPLGHASTLGMTPRSFAIDPSGKWLVVANQAGNSLVVFAIDGATGALAPTGDTYAFDGPAFIGFVEL